MKWRRKQVVWKELSQAEKVEYLKIEQDSPNNSVWLYLIVTLVFAFMGIELGLINQAKLDYALEHLNMTVGAEMLPAVTQLRQNVYDVAQISVTVVLIFALLICIQMFLYVRKIRKFNKEVNEKRGNRH
jgi:hypothetical protein